MSLIMLFNNWYPMIPSRFCFLRPCVSCRCPACVWDALAPGLYEPLSGNLKNRLVLILWSCVFQLASVRMNQLIRAVCPALPGSTYSAHTNLIMLLMLQLGMKQTVNVIDALILMTLLLGWYCSWCYPTKNVFNTIAIISILMWILCSTLLNIS